MEGKFIVTNEFLILPSEPGVMEGYEEPKKFPNCCPFHKSIYKQAKEFVSVFPNCCDEHRLFAAKEYFNIGYYRDLALHTLYRLSYTEYHISKQIDEENWYEDITNYIDYIIMSFGTPAIGLPIYCGALAEYIDLKRPEIGETKAQRLYNYVEGLSKADENYANDVDINELYLTYKKWLEVFPFEVSPLNQLKDHFIKKFPIYSQTPVYNPYTRFIKGKAISKKELILALISKTKELIGTINSIDLFNKGYIKDTQTHRMTLINETHRIKQLALVKDYSEKESEYIDVIKEWLINEKEYFKELSEMLLSSGERSMQPIVQEEVRKNIFNRMPLEHVEKWFMQLATTNSVNGMPFLTTNQVIRFVNKAFVGKADEPKLTLNYGPKEILSLWKLFYQYYSRCTSIENGVERGVQCRDKYIRLLTDNFTNFTFEEVKANFSKSNQVKKEWNLPI